MDQRGWKLQTICEKQSSKDQDKNYIRWRNVGTTDNPADLGSRGGDLFETTDPWWRRPLWLAHQQQWPPDNVTCRTRETQAEATVIREVLAVTIQTNEGHDELMQKWDLWTTIRDEWQVSRFIRNCRAKHQQRITGPITTQETSRLKRFWEKGTHVRCQDTSGFQEDQQRLNLQKNADKLYECRGLIQGDYPIYLRMMLCSAKGWYCAPNFRLSMRESV